MVTATNKRILKRINTTELLTLFHIVTAIKETYEQRIFY